MTEELGNNKGDKYEIKIFNICVNKSISSSKSNRAGSSSKADTIFIHENNNFNLEIKSFGADFSQRKINWTKHTGWKWAINDSTTALYDSLKLKEIYINKEFIPKRFTIENKKLITFEDQKFDSVNFEKRNIEISNEALFLYYKNKNTYYMQIEGSGFYYLDEDIANLGVPKFDGKLFYRFRIKNHNTHIKKKSKEIKIKNYNKKTKKMEIINNPSKKNITYNTGIPSPWNYSFFGITKLKNKPTASDFDLEERDGRKFPNINP